MSFYSMYRIFKDIFKTIFGYKFWRKLLICIIIGVILFFVLHNYGYCAEPDSSYNQIEPVGYVSGVSMSNDGHFVNGGTNARVYIFPINVADTITTVINNAGQDVFRIGVGDSTAEIGNSFTLLTAPTVSANSTYEYEYYNNGYKFLYVGFWWNSNRSVQVFEKVYSTYIKPLVTPCYANILTNGSDVIYNSTKSYFVAFQINKGFNYKVSGLSSDMSAYYTSELNQLNVSNLVTDYQYTKIWLPSAIYTYSHTEGQTVEPTPGTTQYYNETSNYTTWIDPSYTGESITSTPHTHHENFNLLPFYDTISNNEEFTASYTGWLMFFTDTDVSESMEIWTDYNFYDHDTIYIDNRIQNVNSSVQQGTTEINQSVQDMSNTISDNLTNTNYNQSDVSVNTSSIDNVPNSTDGIFTTIFNNFNNAVSGGVSELVIPLPHNSGSITITSDIVSRHLGNLTLLVNAFWMYVFGIYAFRFVNNLIHSIKNGDILNGFNSSNEVITNTMV